MYGLENIDLTAVAIAGTALIAIISLITSIVLARRQRKLLHRYKKLLNGPVEQDLEKLLLEQAAALERLSDDVARLAESNDQLNRAARGFVQKTGVIRFNAFEDTGSDLSFSIALLDGNDNGFVLSSLYGRNESRTYAKPVRGGKSTYPLSHEEEIALAQALGIQEVPKETRSRRRR